MNLSAHDLATWQRGRRRYAIEQRYRYLPWHPILLFSACMRRAIVQLSSGLDRTAVTIEATSLFLAQAKSPGLDVRHGTDTYLLAMDLCATMRTILAYLERITLTTLHEIEPVELRTSTPITWTFYAYADDSGLLHRWVFLDRIDDDAIFHELHKWETISDIIVHQAPMMLHFVAIGSTVNGRRYSPWCRAYKSPSIAGMFRFKKNKGELAVGWTPIYFAENPKNDPERWIDQMIADEVTESLMLHKTVAQPAQVHVDNFYRDVDYEAKQILASDLSMPLNLPMCRTSCDIPYVCPHQVVCYSAKTTIENSGLYERISRVSV